MSGESTQTAQPTSLGAAAASVALRAREIAASTGQDRDHEYRRLLRADVHDVVMRASVDDAVAGPQDLAELAAVVRAEVPAGVEAKLNPRVAVFVRLLREGAVEAAWLLANDNASGVVRPQRPQATWAGGSNLNSQLGLPTLVESDRVFAWLPGFRDPRWNVPDAMFEISERVVLRSKLEVAEFRAGELLLSGVGYLGQLTATAEDTVTVVLSGPGERSRAVEAMRTRRPELVKSSGPDLTRLAWGGWSARVDLARLNAAGSWRVHLSVEQQGVQRRSAVGTQRGPLVAADLPTEPHRRNGLAYRLVGDERTGAMVLQVRSAPPLPEPLVRYLRAGRAAVRRRSGG